ncbi:1832_t:CDS:2, partial [Dentiscutata heterogama]
MSNTNSIEYLENGSPESFQERRYTLYELKMTYDKWESLKLLTCRRSIICAFFWTLSLAFGIFLLILEKNTMHINSIIPASLLGIGSVGTLINNFLSFIKLFPMKKPDKESIDDKIIKSSEQIFKVNRYETELIQEHLNTIKVLSELKVCEYIKNLDKVKLIQEQQPYGLALKFFEELINNLRLTSLISISQSSQGGLKKISPNKTEMKCISRLLSGLSIKVIEDQTLVNVRDSG